jgi:putative transcriptional regulator
MEAKDPLSDLLRSLEKGPLIEAIEEPDAFSEFQALRSQAGLDDVDFARMMGVSLVTVEEWSAHRIKPSGAELKLLRLLLNTTPPR